MGIFDEKLDKKDFSKYKKEIQSALEKLSNEIASKVTDSEDDARQSAERAKVSLEEVESAKISIDNSVNQIESLFESITSKSAELMDTADQAIQQKNQIEEFHEESEVLRNEVNTLKEQMSSVLSESSERLEKISQMMSQCVGLPEKLSEANGQLSQINEKFSQVEDVLNHSVKRKGQIDELHKSILGQNIKNENGETEHVDGLKDDLESAYNGFDERVEKLENEIDDTIESIRTKYNDLLEESSTDYDSVSKKLKSLLPDALAAGLSAAYEKKKSEEEDYLKKSNSLFNRLILCLVLVSCLPFLVDFYLLFVKGVPLLDVISDTPKILLAMIPLYFPILWLAYSTNKKSNLSKRIIEEYTHKSVLGRTYEGLSNQIESISDKEGISDELRVKLLLNILHVSSENPGKLISDYKKSDHPLMEALENSEKLGSSIEKLENIPGFSALVSKLSSKSRKIKKDTGSSIERGLEVNESLEG